MAYNGLTNAGAAYLAARQANNLPIEFLKAKVGDGIVPSGTNPADLTDIISEKMEVEITDIQQAERTLKMTVQVSNESLTTGFYLTEIAIFVNDNGTQVLYWYIGKDNGTPVHDSTKPMKYKNILNIEVSSTPITTVNYTGKDLWIDEETLNAKFGTKEKEILEGIQLARTLGLEYGGELNNSNIKKVDTVYYDTQNKSFFKCFQENSLNYADSNYYEGISNNDLLLKLQNLTNTLGAKFLETTGIPPQTVEEVNAIAGFIKTNCLPPDENFQRYCLYCITFKQASVTKGHIIVRVSSCISFYLFETFIQVSKYCIATSYGSAIPTFVEK